MGHKLDSALGDAIGGVVTCVVPFLLGVTYPVGQCITPRYFVSPKTVLHFPSLGCCSSLVGISGMYQFGQVLAIEFEQIGSRMADSTIR